MIIKEFFCKCDGALPSLNVEEVEFHETIILNPKLTLEEYCITLDVVFMPIWFNGVVLNENI